ncbi:site-specific integrase [Hyphomicrobium sp.]|uniref:site-specific integrase n=1 Tax=Hyphomicrobium sp. TaxID=82 RepID=UPI000FA903E1|nr:site-specific integrase [Hyphomicrobium sp.]RUP07746.1 MAG: site-specific integrase [Hyphomicrobium sp.]
MYHTKILEKNQYEPAAPFTLAKLIDLIAAESSISEKRRSELCSGVRSLSRAMGLQLESTPADPRFIAERLRDLTPAAAKMSKGRLQNCRSYMDAALAFADKRFRRRQARRLLAPHLKALLDNVPDPWQRMKLRPFTHFLDENDIAPGTVDDKTFDAFRTSLNHSLVKDVRTRDRETRKIWNAFIAKAPEQGCREIAVPRYTDHYVLAEAAFPASLWTEVDTYIASRTTKAGAELDDILTEDELFGGDDDAPRSQPIRASTAKLIRYRVRQFASALVLSEVLKPEDVTTLKALVNLKAVGAGLNFFIKRAGGQRRNSQIRGMAYDLLMIARLWVRSPDADLKKLEEIAVKVRPEHQGLPESMRRKLAPFQHIDNVRAFLALPDRIIEEALREKAVDPETANRVATAVWIKIAQRAPLRISNLLSTSLSTNLLRSHAAKDAKVALFYPPEQVKNAKTLEIPLPASTAKLLDIYLTTFRPALIDAPCDWLFPARDSGQKRSSVMSDNIQKLMREYLGFAINPHAFRHLAAKLYLTAHPGRYEDVQLILGHRSRETTISYYVDLEAEEAFRHFDAVLLGLEDASTLRAKDKDSVRKSK